MGSFPVLCVIALSCIPSNNKNPREPGAGDNNGLDGEAPPKGVPFSGFKYMKG